MQTDPTKWTSAEFTAAAVESYWIAFADYLRAEPLMAAREKEHDPKAHMKLFDREAEYLRQCDEERHTARRYAEEAALLRTSEACDRRTARYESKEFR